MYLLLILTNVTNMVTCWYYNYRECTDTFVQTDNTDTPPIFSHLHFIIIIIVWSCTPVPQATFGASLLVEEGRQWALHRGWHGLPGRVCGAGVGTEQWDKRSPRHTTQKGGGQRHQKENVTQTITGKSFLFSVQNHTGNSVQFLCKNKLSVV